MDDYTAEQEYRRWHGGLGKHLAEISGAYRRFRRLRLPPWPCWGDQETRSSRVKLAAHYRGHVI
jgi:hypothetical protein